MTLFHSIFGWTVLAPGLVDSPPTSIIFAPESGALSSPSVTIPVIVLWLKANDELKKKLKINAVLAN